MIEFKFDGTAITLYRTMDTASGSMDVCIDGVCRTVSNNAASTLYKQPVLFGGFTAGVHSVQIRNLAATYSNLDKVLVTSVPSPAAITEGLTENISENITYGNGAWYPLTSASASGTNYIQNNTQNATIDFSFEGTGFSLLRTVGAAATYGTMEVCIDTAPCETVTNINAATVWKQPVFFNGLSSGLHTVQIRNLENKSILFDAIQVYPDPSPLPVGSYEQTDDDILYYGNWTTTVTGLASGGSHSYS